MADTSSEKGLGRAEYARHSGRAFPFLRGSDALRKRMERRLTSPYQAVLFISDLFLAFAGFELALQWTGTARIRLADFLDVDLLVLSLSAVAFFKAYHLYSYHHLFLKKGHFFGLMKAFVWGGLTLCVILFMCSRPWIISDETDVYFVFLVALMLTVLSRFYWRYLIFVLSSIGVGFLSVGILARLNPGQKPLVLGTWHPALLGLGLAAVFILLSRYFCIHVVFNRWLRRNFRKHVIIVGTDEDAMAITRHIIETDAPFWVNGFVAIREGEKSEVPLIKRRLGDLKHLAPVVKNERIHEIIVTDEDIDKASLISILDYCTSEGITVWFPPKLMPVIEMKLFIDSFCGIPMIRLCSQKNIVLSRRFKHAIDALIGLPLLMALLPLFGLVAALIKLNSPGPVFYKARAIGRDGNDFTMYKFRSMRMGTATDIHKDYVVRLIKGELQKEAGQDRVFKITDDPRITRIGKYIRKFSIDELPQILNVLRGDMSLVGPRPCLPYEFEIYKEWHKKRLSIRPGITGLWQVAGRSAVTFEEMVILDLYYIYNRSLLLDMNILYETIFVVLMKKGAY